MRCSPLGISKKFSQIVSEVLTQIQPLVLTNDDLKREFQVSDSTLNRLIKLTDFPNCWYGIRGHYSRDQVIEWYQRNDYEDFKEKMRLLRSL